MTHFIKYQGAGNDFIVIDDRLSAFPFEDKNYIQRLCHRQKGIGADGLILLQIPQYAHSDFRMRIFNADGSEASMCGNGLRCLVHFVHTFSPKKKWHIETAHAVHACYQETDTIFTELGAPKIQFWKLPLDLHELYVVHTGVPHAVMFVQDLESVLVEELGRKIRHHPHFQPEGVNVNFAQLLSDNILALRTYERGVEAETLACGTGAAAVGFVASKLHGLPSPLSLLPRSGDRLHLEIVEEKLFLSGPAVPVFTGIC